ncbi:exosortase F system-associated membrane protein [Flavobacterium sp.]|jgi:exosortase F-associated protein|uniref:exosortase F system-associated membrane protein n=1 Tax=Flavobacterium sp. TaxID=239 RepID=UPI0037C02A43
MQKRKNKAINISIIGILVVSLLLIRMFEKDLFYDPFLEFFRGDTQNKIVPEFDAFKLFLGLLYRFFINGMLTILILYFLFKDFLIVKLTSFLLLIFFVVLIIAFFSLLHFSESPDYLFVFYVRRFLIQPLFLILFVPAFFYQKVLINNKL